MIEFPQRDSPLALSVCKSTGNLIVAAANLVIVYKFMTKVKEATKESYIDFNECLHVFHNFIPTEIALSEDVIGCLSPIEVHIFKVKFSDPNSEEDEFDRRFRSSVSVYSFTSDSETDSSLNNSQRMADFCKKSPDSPESAVFLNSSLKNVTWRRQMDSETLEPKVEGYSGNVRRHPDFVCIGDDEAVAQAPVLPEIEEANRQYLSLVNAPKIMEQSLGPAAPPLHRTTTVKYVNPSRNLEADCVTLVHCKLLRSEEQHDSFKNLRLQPVYWREYRVRKSQHKAGGSNGSNGVPKEHPLQSGFHVHLMSLSAFFTSENEGYLYHLPGHLRKPGKGCGGR